MITASTTSSFVEISVSSDIYPLNGGSQWSMSAPTTPTKQGQDINRLLRSLNTEWGLRLPVRDAPMSPSKIPRHDRRGERIYQKIRYLSFKDPKALQIACTHFETHAKQQQSFWVYKPHAETETLPSQPAAALRLRKGAYSRLNEVYEADSDALEETLLRFLDEAVDSRSLFTGKRSETNAGENNVAKGTDQLQESSVLSGPWSGLQGVSNNSRLLSADDALLSSSSFNPSQDTSSILQRIIMTDHRSPTRSAAQPTSFVTSAAVTYYEQSTSEDIFTTPPTTPPRQHGAEEDPSRRTTVLPTANVSNAINNTEPNNPAEFDDRYFVQEADEVKLPSKTGSGGKKRPLTDNLNMEISRKMTRDTQGRRPWQTYDVRHLEPTFIEITGSIDNLSFMTASTTTATSSRTTPNTSFYTESAATSFGPSMSDTESDGLAREQHYCNQKMLSATHLDSPEEMMGIDCDTSRQLEGSDSNDITTIDLPRTLSKVLAVRPPSTQNVSGHQWDNDAAPSLEKNTIETRAHRLIPTADLGGQCLRQVLEEQTPFGLLEPTPGPPLAFRQLYETSRVALDCKTPNLIQLNQDLSDYEHLWSKLRSLIPNPQVMPVKSKLEAWDRADNDSACVVYSGDLTFADKTEGPIFQFHLKPMTIDRSTRVSRKFGGDRVLILGIPGMAVKELPGHLKHDPEGVRKAIINWLYESHHRFLGRTWCALYPKAQQAKSKVRKDQLAAFNGIRHRVYLFAVDGQGFKRRPENPGNGHVAMTRENFLEWFMPLKLNTDQYCLKLYSRLAHAVSTTIPTVVFQPNEIVRTHHAYADSPGVRSIAQDRRVGCGSDGNLQAAASVMNDGCARMSRAAAKAVAEKLGLYGQMPSVFQARIGGAKGIWMVDALGEAHQGTTRDYWIEITDSQVKFESYLSNDPAHLTFEVLSMSKSLSSATLNFQFIPILAECGVPGEVFERLLKEDLQRKVSELEGAMDSGLALRKWIQDNGSVVADGSQSQALEMTGGLPTTRAARIRWFVEHGFEPKTCRMLKSLCFKAASAYCEGLETRMHIGIGRSATAYMIADPLAVLKEGEVHIAFSGTFSDEASGFRDTMLNDMEVLVARNPAYLPTDIQKVRAVFKPELAIYKDVIVFSSRGQCSLADKLSGGDYDGDRAWFCWDPDLVAPFSNAKPYYAPSLGFYGITKDETKVCDIIHSPDYLSEFLRKGFEFNLRAPLLGICVNYHEALCYWRKSISFPLAQDIAALLGHLVDSAKGGLDFSEETWARFKANNSLPKRQAPPSYKNKGESRPTNHIIDHLVFNVAKAISEKALSEFSKRFEEAGDWDDDLNAVWKAEDQGAQHDSALKIVFRKLRADLEELFEFWCVIRKPDVSFKAKVEQARQRFLDIQPVQDSKSQMAQRWAKDEGSTKGSWLRLKASMLWNKYYRCGVFVWYICGKELGELKVLGKGTGHSIVEDLWCAYKLDGKAAKKILGATAQGAEGMGRVIDGDSDGNEDAFGDWDDAFEEGMIGW